MMQLLPLQMNDAGLILLELVFLEVACFEKNPSACHCACGIGHFSVIQLIFGKCRFTNSTLNKQPELHRK
jgi:hypothetical protein